MVTAITIYAQQNDFTKLTGPYLSQKPPGMTPEVFAPGIVSKEGAQSKLNITPDGSELIFKTMKITSDQGNSPTSRVIYFESVKLKNGKWNSPVVLTFSCDFVNDEPALSTDGQMLFFVSNRPKDGLKEIQRMPDIWLVKKNEDKWSDPQNPGIPVNTDGVDAKPDKIFLENSNLAIALKEKPDIGNIRETFVLNQLLNAGVSVSSPSDGDFLADGLTIEVGDKSKSESQVKHLDNYLIAADNIEIGGENKVPIWLFGFLY